MNIKGLKITDIMDMTWEQLNRLGESEFRQLTSRLVSASNKRIRRLEKTTRGTSSFAYQTVEERGRMFSTKGKDLNQLRNEFATARGFLRMKTSTVSGWNKYRKATEKRLGKESSGGTEEWGDSTWSKYWKVYRRFEETHGGTMKKGDSERIQKMLLEVMENSDKRKSADYFQWKIEDEYNEMYMKEEFADIEPDDSFDVFDYDDEEDF